MSTRIDFADESCVLVHADTDEMVSTPCELNVDNLHKGVLSKLSTILTLSLSAQTEKADNAEQRQLRVYLRVRPFSKGELANDKDQVKKVPWVDIQYVYMTKRFLKTESEN